MGRLVSFVIVVVFVIAGYMYFSGGTPEEAAETTAPAAAETEAPAAAESADTGAAESTTETTTESSN